MRRVTLTLAAVAAQVITTAGVALAEGGSVLSPPGGDGVKGEVVRPPQPTAFTGADIGTLAVALIALIVIGSVLVLAGRRRARVAS